MPFLVDTLQLKSFIAIAETGTFGQAATTVNRTQSALSLQIKKLEEQLGCELFDRTNRRVTLTRNQPFSMAYYRSSCDRPSVPISCSAEHTFSLAMAYAPP